MSLAAPRIDLVGADVERFRAAIVRHIGLQFDDAKLPVLDEVLRRRLKQKSCASALYLAQIETDPDGDELCELAQELTVGETYFFRHNDQFRALAEVVLPELVGARQNTRSLRLLSAGCASGEEAYSLAIVAQEAIADRSFTVAIRGIDLNPAILVKARRARYSTWALRETPLDMRSKWFRAEGREWVLADALRSAVAFEVGNLAGEDPTLWQPSNYDVIFCRNVLMYFSPDQMCATVARFADALAPGGYLFLGHAETLRGVSEDFRLCHSHETFYYQRTGPRSSARRKAAHGAVAGACAPAAVPAMPALPPPTLGLATGWVDSIQQASERVTALIAAAQAAKPLAPPWQLAPVFDLLRHERFGEALDYVRSGAPQNACDPDVLLVEAVLLAQRGEHAAAEDVCQGLLVRDEQQAGAHYVLALCREHAGERARAMEHDRRAARLDPSFAMPRLHCGLMARALGDRVAARRELALALDLLKREETSRLLLFGGGFARDALIALARAAVAECAGRS